MEECENSSVTASWLNIQSKNRFYSFGMVKDSIITVEEITLARNTMEIRIKNTKVAIRFSEAAKIQIEIVNE